MNHAELSAPDLKMQTGITGRSIGAILIDSGFLSPENAERVLRSQKETGQRFGDAAIALGLLTPDDINLALARQFDYPYGRTPQGHIKPTLILIMIGLAATLLLSALIFDPSRLLEHLLMSNAGNDVLTLTGRLGIWEVAITEWERNPLFGYGPEIWEQAFRARIGMSYAFSAHNQFLQALSAAGLFGFVTLVTYLWLLGRYATRAAPFTKGVSTALFVTILLRCITETPMTMSTMLNGDFLTQLILFQIALVYSQSQPASTPSKTEKFPPAHPAGPDPFHAAWQRHA